MATIVHRRLVRPPAPEPRGPGASFSALTWVGWVSLIAAVAWFVNGTRPVLDMGDIRSWSWPEVAWLAWREIADAAIIALPAALEWGVPSARTRTPVLMRGAVLLAPKRPPKATPPPVLPGQRPKKPKRVFTPLAPLYKVENAFARLGTRRRLSRCYEGSPESARAWLEVACVGYLFRRLRVEPT